MMMRLLSIKLASPYKNEKHKAFDEYLSRETRALFLDIFKAFDLIENYLFGCYLRLALNGASWRPVLADVSQRSVLGSLFADDTSLFTIVYVSAQVFNSDLRTTEEWGIDGKCISILM